MRPSEKFSKWRERKVCVSGIKGGAGCTATTQADFVVLVFSKRIENKFFALFGGHHATSEKRFGIASIFGKAAKSASKFETFTNCQFAFGGFM